MQTLCEGDTQRPLSHALLPTLLWLALPCHARALWNCLLQTGVNLPLDRVRIATLWLRRRGVDTPGELVGLLRSLGVVHIDRPYERMVEQEVEELLRGEGMQPLLRALREARCQTTTNATGGEEEDPDAGTCPICLMALGEEAEQWCRN